MAGAIVVLGGLNFDYVVETERLPHPGETFEGRRFYTAGGGKGANQAVAAARLAGPETPVRMVGRTGDDPEGAALRDLLREAGVDTSAVSIDRQRRSGVAIILVDDAGENTVLPVYGANAVAGAAELAGLAEALEGASMLLLQQEIPLPTCAAAMRAARERGVRVMLDPAPVRATPPPGFHAAADILTPNQGEAEALTGLSAADPEAAGLAASQLQVASGGSVVVTMAGGGAVFRGPGERGARHVPGHSVRVVASVGAGDAFNGGLAVALSEGQSLAQAVALGNAAAALAVTRPGVQEAMPRRAEVERLLGEQ